MLFFPYLSILYLFEVNFLKFLREYKDLTNGNLTGTTELHLIIFRLVSLVIIFSNLMGNSDENFTSFNFELIFKEWLQI